MVEEAVKKARDEGSRVYQKGDEMMTLDTCESTAKKYQAWVNNRVAALLLAIEKTKACDELSLLKHEFFLDEIEHHFMDGHAGSRVGRAFQYLRRYLKHDPSAKAGHRRGALKMLGVIYGQLGFDGRKILAAA